MLINIILILINGSTISLPWANEHIPAIIEAWYPGQSGGKAIAEVLYGDYNPGGKLPMTFYNGINDLPPFDDYDVRNGRTYMYFEGEPLYPFGYGLSYTNFKIKNVRLNDTNFSKSDTLQITFNITNTGLRHGSEVPQLYIEENGIKKLKAFKRIFLNKDESLESSMKVAIKEFQSWDTNENKYIVKPGDYSIHLGTSSQDFLFTRNIKVN